MIIVEPIGLRWRQSGMSASSVLRPAPLLAILILAACAVVPGAPSPSPRMDHPDGDALVFSITTSGGFVPADTHLITIPSFALTGNGQVIVAGPQIAIYPGPALPNLQVRILSPAGIQHLLERITATGLFDADHQFSAGNMFVADAPDTVFTFSAAGREVVTSVYALGIVGDGSGLPANFPADELAAHEALNALVSDLSFPDDFVPAHEWLSEWTAYQPSALRLLVANADNWTGDIDPGEPIVWPVSGNAASFGEPTLTAASRCGVVTGADARAWWDALTTANQLTLWSSDGHVYHVTARPILPYEEAICPQPDR